MCISGTSDWAPIEAPHGAPIVETAHGARCHERCAASGMGGTSNVLVCARPVRALGADWDCAPALRTSQGSPVCVRPHSALGEG